MSCSGKETELEFNSHNSLLINKDEENSNSKIIETSVENDDNINCNNDHFMAHENDSSTEIENSNLMEKISKKKQYSKRNFNKRNEKDKTQMDIALALVLQNKLSLRAAAHLYKIPFSTLRTRKIYLQKNAKEIFIKQEDKDNKKDEKIDDQEDKFESLEENYDDLNESIENQEIKNPILKTKLKSLETNGSKRLYIRHDQLDRLFKINGEPISLLDKKNSGNIDKLLKKASNFKSTSSESVSPTFTHKITGSPIKLSSLFSNSILSRPKKCVDTIAKNNISSENEIEKTTKLLDESILENENTKNQLSIKSDQNDKSSMHSIDDSQSNLNKKIDLIDTNSESNKPISKKIKISNEKITEADTNNHKPQEVSKFSSSTGKKSILREIDCLRLEKYKKYLIKPTKKNANLLFNCDKCKLIFLNENLLNEHTESNCHFNQSIIVENKDSNNELTEKTAYTDEIKELSLIESNKYFKCNFCKNAFLNKSTFMSHLSSSCNNILN